MTIMMTMMMMMMVMMMIMMTIMTMMMMMMTYDYDYDYVYDNRESKVIEAYQVHRERTDHRYVVLFCANECTCVVYKYLQNYGSSFLKKQRMIQQN